MSQSVDVVPSPTTAPGSVSEELKSERVQEMLQAMPGWSLLPESQAIGRTFQFPSKRVAAKFADYASTYAAEEGHNINLDVSLVEVSLTVTGPKVRGRYGELTEESVTFARKFG
jgi:pterin-4a-carbinolamine dehydratase